MTWLRQSYFRVVFALALALAVLAAGTVAALAASTSVASSAPAASAKTAPGLEAARTISLITGVAISPLLGVGAVGAYDWWKAPPEKRAKLPWFAKPWFWIPALALVLLVGLKDVLGTAAPTAMKKPFDVAEAVENKISALIAAGAFVPLVISIFPESAGDGSLAPAQLGFAAISLGSIGNALLVPFAIGIFFIVWLASHAINMLILLSPFATVDMALKTCRMGLLSLVATLSLANAYVGAIFCLGIIVVSYFIAGWSFRLMIFGSVYVWDYVTLRRRRFQPGAEFNAAFTARKIQDVPVRTYGKLMRGKESQLTFHYRPWLFLPQRALQLEPAERFIGRGLFCPELDQVNEGKATALFIFPPRQLTHEDALARVYDLREVRDIGVLKGLKAAWNWVRSLFSPRSRLPEPVPSVVPQ